MAIVVNLQLRWFISFATSSPAPRRNPKRRIDTEFITDDGIEPIASLTKRLKVKIPCTVCQKEFARNDTLKRHMKTFHK